MQKTICYSGCIGMIPIKMTPMGKLINKGSNFLINIGNLYCASYTAYVLKSEVIQEQGNLCCPQYSCYMGL